MSTATAARTAPTAAAITNAPVRLPVPVHLRVLALLAAIPAAALAAATSSAASSSCAPTYSQCGGYEWAGPTCCIDSVCVYASMYYSQCLPSGDANTATSTSTTTSSSGNGAAGFAVVAATTVASASPSASSSTSSSLSSAAQTSAVAPAAGVVQSATTTTAPASSSAVNQSGAGPIIAGVGAACVVLLASFALAFAYQRSRGGAGGGFVGSGRRSQSSSSSMTGSGALIGISVNANGGGLIGKPKFSKSAAAAAGGGGGIYVEYGDTKHLARQILDADETDEAGSAVGAAEPEFSYHAPAAPRLQNIGPTVTAMPLSPDKRQMPPLHQLHAQAPAAAMQVLRGVVQIPQGLRKPASQKLSQSGSDGPTRNPASKLGAMPSHLASDLNVSNDPLQQTSQNSHQQTGFNSVSSRGGGSSGGSGGRALNQLPSGSVESMQGESLVLSFAARPGAWRKDNTSSYLSYPASIISSQAPSSLYMDTIVQNDRIEFSDSAE
ncbi:hypothetical protein HDU84_002570 [Entophlyctis sp. JEL0112]|nr:hypothetical protein HDU84_002570 [Entophlyctis sp. JEL0112]